MNHTKPKLNRFFSDRFRARCTSPTRQDQQQLDQILQLRKQFRSESDQRLKQRATELKQHWHRERNQNDASALEAIAFGLTMIAAQRMTGMEPYEVQVLAGLAMARGAVAEMQTGEGKTLTSLFPIVFHGLSGGGVHVATVNAYLAERDFELLKPVIELLGLTVGISNDGDETSVKRNAYQQNVTFATGYELGFDFLRDQTAWQARGNEKLGERLRRRLTGTDADGSFRRQQGFAAAVIDEIDSVLIDEATTPLVLSAGRADGSPDPIVYQAANWLAEQLTAEKDFIIDEKGKSLNLTHAGIERTQSLRQEAIHRFSQLENSLKTISNPAMLRPWQNYVESALRGQQLMLRDVHYVVRDERVEIVDENTGRIFPDRNWRDGLHQAVETKEGVPISEERKTIARISRQRYFQRYQTLCGMTGTAVGQQRELIECYRLSIVVIPSRKASQRELLPTRYFGTATDKLAAVVAQIFARHQLGQPVLIGTRTIAQTRVLSESLTQQTIPHQLLNGVQDADESSLIAVAGEAGMITVATNMAGRGTDIKPDATALAAGGLHVIGFERNLSARIDRQLLGRAGRQGDPGSGQFFVCAADELILRNGAGIVKALARIKDSRGINSPDLDRQIARLQQVAESESYRARRAVMREELWLDKIKKTVA